MKVKGTSSNDLGTHAIAQVMSDSYDNVANVGRNVVKVICSAVSKVYRGRDIPKDDQDTIVEELATLRGWSGSVANVRKSEARAILATYAELPKAAEKLADKGKGNWKDAVALARKLRNGDTINKAIAALTTERAPLPPKARASMLVKQLLSPKLKLSATFRGQLEDLAKAEKIKL